MCSNRGVELVKRPRVLSWDEEMRNRSGMLGMCGRKTITEILRTLSMSFQVSDDDNTLIYVQFADIITWY